MLPTAYAQFSTPLVSPTFSSAIATAVPTTLSTAASSTSFILGTSAIASTSHRDTAPNTTPNGGPQGDPSDGDDQKSGLLNYYFVFLALFIGLLFLGVYFIHKRKRARKAAFQNSSQNALARDLGNWNNPRRWMHGNLRTNPTHHEGLNELGEAPPPYKAPEADATPGAEPQIPLRTLSRSSANMPIKPPDYGEVLRASRMVEENDRPTVTRSEPVGSLGTTPTQRP
jgi:hypothetical protein